MCGWVGWVWLLVRSVLVYRCLKAAYVAWKPLYLYVVAPGLGWLPSLRGYERSWTVVTGCTDGIGRAYLEELGRRGLRRFLLISRSPAKLATLASDLEQSYGAQCEWLAFDFDTSDYRKLQEFLERFEEVGILVNNVGIGPTDLIRFGDQEPGEARRILRVNTLSAVEMTELVLHKMERRGRGVVVTISSICGVRYVPFMSTYPASKAAISLLSEALRDEYAFTGIKFQVPTTGTHSLPCLVTGEMREERERKAMTDWKGEGSWWLCWWLLSWWLAGALGATCCKKRRRGGPGSASESGKEDLVRLSMPTDAMGGWGGAASGVGGGESDLCAGRDSEAGAGGGGGGSGGTTGRGADSSQVETVGPDAVPSGLQVELSLPTRSSASPMEKGEGTPMTPTPTTTATLDSLLRSRSDLSTSHLSAGHRFAIHANAFAQPDPDAPRHKLSTKHRDTPLSDSLAEHVARLTKLKTLP